MNEDKHKAKWESVGPGLERIPVPGGWIYANKRLFQGLPVLSNVFVPFARYAPDQLAPRQSPEDK